MFSFTLTSWRCPGLGPGKAKRELVEDGESEQSPRGLCDVSNTCSWKEEWNDYDSIIFDCFQQLFSYFTLYLGGGGGEGEDFDHGI